MRFFGFMCSLFVLAGSVFGSEVLNPPNGSYIIVNDHIINFVYQSGGADFAFGLGLSVPSFEEAQRVDEYIRSHVSAQNLAFNGYLGPFVLRRGGSEIVGGFVVLQTQEYSGEDYDDILNAVRACGYTITDEPLSYYDQGIAQISNDEPGDDDDVPPGLPPGVGPTDFIRFEYENGRYIWHAGTVNGVDVTTGTLTHWCVGFYTSNRDLAFSLYEDLPGFYNSYQWVNNQRPQGFAPHVHHIYEYENGSFLREYWFVGIFEAPGPSSDHMQYVQFRTDFLMEMGHFYDVMQPDFDSTYTPNSAAPYSDNLTARSSLAGIQLAQGADSAGGVSYELPQGIVFSQSTTAGVDAAQGDFVGESTVRSTADASTNGTTVNITNNTEINTNLELGETPDDEVYEAEEAEEKEVADSEELLTEQEPEYTYIDSSSSEYKIDYEKLFEDCKEKIDDIFGTDELTTFLSSVPSGGNIQPWVVQWVDPWVHYNWGFTVDVGYVANLQIVQIIRMICNFGLYLGTLFMSIRLFA